MHIHTLTHTHRRIRRVRPAATACVYLATPAVVRSVVVWCGVACGVTWQAARELEAQQLKERKQKELKQRQEEARQQLEAQAAKEAAALEAQKEADRAGTPNQPQPQPASHSHLLSHPARLASAAACRLMLTVLYVVCDVWAAQHCRAWRR